MNDQISTDNPNPSSAFGGRWLERGLMLCVLLASALAISGNVADPDLWGHVQYGRDLLRDGLPATTTYSFTAENYRWINHENLAEVLLAVGADTVGARGLLVIKCLLGLATLGLISWHALRSGARPVAAVVVCLLVAVNLTPHWSIRPQLLTYTYYTLLLALLAWSFQGWAGRWNLPWLEKSGRFLRRFDHPSEVLQFSSDRLRCLWLAPPLFLIWANSHGGFVAGYAIFVAYLLLRSFEAIACCGLRARGVVSRLLLMIVVSGLATLINPYGPSLHGWLIESLSQPRPEITEWHPPELLSFASTPLLLLAFTAVLVWTASRRSRDFTHSVILLLVLWQTLQHARHAPFLAIAFGFWAPVHLNSLLNRFRGASAGSTANVSASRVYRGSIVGALCLAYGLLGWMLYQRLSDMPVYRDQFPVAAVNYMAERNLRGKLVVTYNWAQYLIAAFGTSGDGTPETRVAFDGRFRTCYPQEIVDMHFDLVLGDLGPDYRFRSPTSGSFDPGRVLEFGEPNLVLLNRFQPHSEQVMHEKSDQWVLLYQDRMAQLWGRRTIYDDPQVATYVPESQRVVSDDEQQGSVCWPALPSTNPSEADGLRSLAQH